MRRERRETEIDKNKKDQIYRKEKKSEARVNNSEGESNTKERKIALVLIPNTKLNTYTPCKCYKVLFFNYYKIWLETCHS